MKLIAYVAAATIAITGCSGKNLPCNPQSLEGKIELVESMYRAHNDGSLGEVGIMLHISTQGKPTVPVPFVYVGQNASDSAILSINSVKKGDHITVQVCTEGQYQGYPVGLPQKVSGL